MWFDSAYTFLGGLGIFFFGMKNLSESLQAISGAVIRRAISTLTSNRLMGVAVGAFVTTLVQSSSVTTVMTVGLVNASLMELTQAIGVIMGANIGTTITGWIIAIKVGKYGLLFVGLGIFPLLFARNSKFKHVGSLLVALGLVFMGLEYMSSAFKPLRKSEEFISLLHYFSADTITTLLACVGIGALLTIIIQSSSAMLGVTIALAATGTITFQTAAALVLGENIGTTITAVLASIGANTEAKRAARAHAAFNLIAVFAMLPFFWLYIEFVDMVIGGGPDVLNSEGEKPFIAAHIAGAHTMFNVLATICFLPFVNQLSRFVIWITPAPLIKEVPHLKYLTSAQDFEAPSFGLAVAEKELQNLSDITGRAVRLTSGYITGGRFDKKSSDKIMHYEDITDSIQGEITVFLRRVQKARLTEEQSAFAYALIRAADELESIADYCASITRAYNRLTQAGETFSSDAQAEIKEFTDAVVSYFDDIHEAITHKRDWDPKYFERKHSNLTEIANKIRDHHRQRLAANVCTPGSAMVFSDIVVGLRKLKGHALNISEALTELPTE